MGRVPRPPLRPPVPDPGADRDVLLEIDLQGARQVRALRPDATLVLLVPPSPDVQADRLRSRGDDEAHVARRVAEGAEEARAGREIADAVVVNETVAQATADVASILELRRSGAPTPRRTAPPAPGRPPEA